MEKPIAKTAQKSKPIMKFTSVPLPWGSLSAPGTLWVDGDAPVRPALFLPPEALKESFRGVLTEARTLAAQKLTYRRG